MHRLCGIALCLILGAAAHAADSADPPTTADTPASTKKTPEPETWEQRLRRLRQEDRQRALDAFANRPTAWQLQNPSGAQNRYPTDVTPRGYVTTNTYSGPQYRDWNNQSAPVMVPTLPATYSPAPSVIFSNVPLAPNTYWGPANLNWSNVRVGSAVPNGLGGWNYVPGN